MSTANHTTKTQSGLLFSDFDTVIDGKQVSLYQLTNRNGAEICITNYGGIVVSLLVPDSDGTMTDVVLGHSTIDGYLHSPEKFLGALIGRYGNRIGGCRFNLDGKCHSIRSNNPDCALHGGIKGYNEVVWEASQIDTQTLHLSYLSPDGEEGFPGNLKVEVTYALTNETAMEIHYRATTDKATVCNLTHHSFFNLNGDGGGEVTNHIVTIDAPFYTPMDDKSVPTGEIASVAGTPMDFLHPVALGQRIDDDFEQLRFGRGYDHNYVLAKKFPGEYAFAAEAYSPRTGIVMTVYTTEPGVQLYTGNWLNGFTGKCGRRYSARTAVCFETQQTAFPFDGFTARRDLYANMPLPVLGAEIILISKFYKSVNHDTREKERKYRCYHHDVLHFCDDIFRNQSGRPHRHDMGTSVRGQ